MNPTFLHPLLCRSQALTLPLNVTAGVFPQLRLLAALYILLWWCLAVCTGVTVSQKRKTKKCWRYFFYSSWLTWLENLKVEKQWDWKLQKKILSVDLSYRLNYSNPSPIEDSRDPIRPSTRCSRDDYDIDHTTLIHWWESNGHNEHL